MNDARADAQPFGDLGGANDVLRVDFRRHAERVRPTCDTKVLRTIVRNGTVTSAHDRAQQLSGPGGAPTPRGLAKTCKEVSTWVMVRVRLRG